jgi:hypothetical protein
MTRIRILALSIIITLLALPLAIAEEKVDRAAISRLKSEGMQNSKVMATLLALTDVNGPRLTNSPGYRNAAEWCVKQLKEWGIDSARLEPWGDFGKGWSVNYFHVNMTAPEFSPFIAWPKAWTGSIEGELTGTPVRIDLESDADLSKYAGKLKGAIVLTQPLKPIETLFDVEARRYTAEELMELTRVGAGGGRRFGGDINVWRARFERQRKVQEFLEKENVGAILEPSDWDEHTIRVGSGGSREPGDKPGTPAFVVSIEHYNRMIRMLDAGKSFTLSIALRTTFHTDDLKGYNVIAEIPGTDPKLKDEVVIIGGHLDSWHAGTGAVDNATGCAVAMEAARLIKSLDLKPRRTIRVALWGGEEQGLLGSRGYVKNYYADPSVMKPLPDHAKISAYYNMDNGGGAFRGIYLQGNESVRPIFEAWMEPLRDLGMTTLAFRNTGSTDHASFDAVGLPGFQFIQDPLSYMTRNHHSNLDVYDQAVPEDLMKNSVIMATFALQTANRDELLPRKPLPAPRPERPRF